MQRSAFAGSLQATALLASLASWWGHRFSLYLIHFLISPFLNLVFLTFTSSLAGKSSFLLHLTFSICCISPVSFFLSLFQTRTVTFASAMETPMLNTTSTFSSLSFFLHFPSLSFTFLHFCRWGTRRTLRGAECSRPATGATSRLSSGRSSPRRRQGWDTTLMNCSWGLWCRWGEILGTKLIWILYDRARFRLRENNAHSRQPQATIKETVKGFFNLLAGKGDEKRKSCRNLNIWRPRKGCWQYSYISHITEIMIISRIKYYRDDAYVKLLNYFTSAFCIFLVANAINSH